MLSLQRAVGNQAAQRLLRPGRTGAGLVVQRVLSEEEKAQKGTLEAELATHQATIATEKTRISGLKGREKMLAERALPGNPATGGVVRVGLLLKALAKKEAEPPPLTAEERNAQQAAARVAMRADRAEREEAAARASAATAAKKLELASEIAGTAAAADEVERLVRRGDAAIAAVPNDRGLKDRPGITEHLAALAKADRDVYAARTQASSVTGATTKEAAERFSASAEAAKADAVQALAELKAGIDAERNASELIAQTDYHKAGSSLERGYASVMAKFILNSTYVSSDESPKGFGGECRLPHQDNWTIHVHRSSTGGLSKAHLKPNPQSGVVKRDIPITGKESLRGTLDALGVPAVDTRAGDSFKWGRKWYGAAAEAKLTDRRTT